MDEVRNQYDFCQTEGGVVAHEEKPAVAGKIPQSVDVGPTQIHDRSRAIGEREDRPGQGLHPPGWVRQCAARVLWGRRHAISSFRGLSRR